MIHLIFSFLLAQSLAATKSSIVGDYNLKTGAASCLPHLKVRLECDGIVLQLNSDSKDSQPREDRFCKINQGRQSKQNETTESLQTYTAQVTSKEVTEISKRETWHTIVKETKELNYIMVDHSLILDPKFQEITSSRLTTSANARLESTTATQVCTYKRLR